jgi:hypothetical protein
MDLNSSEIASNTAYSNNNQQKQNIAVSKPASTQMPFSKVTSIFFFRSSTQCVSQCFDQ